MISQLFMEFPKHFRRLYEEPVISSSLFRSFSEFEQQIIFRFITEGGEMRQKEEEKIINTYYEDNKVMLKSTIDRFQQLGILEYINEQRIHKLNSKFSQSLQSFIAEPKLPQQVKLLMEERQQDQFQSFMEEPLLHLLFDQSVSRMLQYCNLKVANLTNRMFQLGATVLTRQNFHFIRATDAQRIGILVKGYLKYRDNPQILRQILTLSLLKPKRIYQITERNRQILPQLQKLRLLKRYKNKYFVISHHLHHFAFETKQNPQTQDAADKNVSCKAIIETNFKVYITVKSKNPKTYQILKAIMSELLKLEHEQYDFDELIVGSITQEKMNSLFDQQITSVQYFTFFRQYMDSSLSIEKDLGKWKKLKFLGLEGPNNEQQIPNNVKQEVKLWEKLRNEKGQYGQIDLDDSD